MAVTYIRSDLEFILQQILIAEQHAAGADLTTLIPNAFVPFGLRTVDGSFNNLVPGNEDFGAADELFPRLTDPLFRDDADGDTFDANGPAPGGEITNTDFGAGGDVVDADPRIISNLIVDQTSNNPAAVAIAGSAGADGVWGTDDDELNEGVSILRTRPGLDGILGTADDIADFSFDNVAPDEGLSAPFNLWFVFFGQFFDHGLDLVEKGGNGTVFIPLQPDDPLINGADGTPGTADDLPPELQFMVLTRATTYAGPGPDGIVGDDPNTPEDESLDDTIEHLNQTSPFVDQNQTYTSTPSHQVFLREYQFNAEGRPVATGRLITNRDLVDGEFGNGDDIDLGGMSTWAIVKAQARDMLGIQLTDHDVANIPLLKVDPYGNFIPGANGFAQIIVDLGADGIAQTDDDVVIEGDPGANGGLGVAIPLGAPRTGQGFLLDIAHSANPFSSQTGLPLTADADTTIGDDGDPNTYDDELLAEHFMAGDGRVNENIALTAVHHVFHSEHNRLVDHTKDVILASGDVAFLNQWLLVPVTEIPADPSTLVWNGERLFQAAKFGTEMQYQHLVFEEFARKIQPNVDEFLPPEGFATQIDPAILAEFAHTVYRFGHSMLLDEIDRLDPNFVSSEIGLIEAFLNPLAFNEGGTLSPEEAAGAVVRGTTRQVGNEIDEFKTEALRNNLLGLPLDLATINLARGRETGIPSLNAARREFYELTGDSQLTPYESWIDFMQGIEHPESLVNFIAAYGTHEAVTLATTLADKRAAASLLVFGDGDDTDGVTIGGVTYTDRLDFLYGAGAWASSGVLPKDLDGVTTTGVGSIDFWIGGLAERIMPFGGFLGSTFNFVFETQLEALQNGDRLYYLARLAGLNFLTELENNSFAKMIMANTDATHLPADVFSTPAFILEVDPTKQFTGLNEPGADGIQGDDPTTPGVDEGADDIAGADGIAGNSDPVGGSDLNPLVIRDNPATPVLDTNYLRYTGGDHVVLGGTDGDDSLIASIGDDTIWGDGGNDRLEGGYGNDNIEGGDGDDIITDIGGDDILKGNDGNDVIQGGNGFNLILGGFGNDFIITGEDVSETFGGPGNDFILGAQMNLPTFGNEGDDWIEIGTSDGAGGDNFDPQESSPFEGHDVFITGGGFDEVDGEGGDDIMVGSDGEDHFAGGGGFDWASYEHDLLGVKADLEVNDFIEPPVAPSNQGLQDRFAEVEGLSGSAFSDILRGSEADAAEIDVEGTLNSALTAEGIARIDGLQELLDQLVGPGTTRFASGDIVLGGGGSDILEGRGGDDLIDGDSWLNVRVSVRANTDGTGPELFSVESITQLVPHMLSGAVNPGQLVIVREILNGGPAFDTAFFSGTQDQYTIIVDDGADGLAGTADDIVTVADNVAGRDGVDRLVNVERLQFSDSSFTVVPGLNNDPVGQPTIDDDTPQVGQTLTASAQGVLDFDNPNLTIDGPVAFFWQVERDPAGAPGVFEDIVDEAGGNPASQVGASFRVTADLDGLRLRVKAIYQDANGVLETVFSEATAAVAPGIPPPPAPVLPDGSNVESAGIHLITSDLQFILDQIKIAEQHVAGGDLIEIIGNSRLPFGLRTVDGSFNNLVQSQTEFGAADELFPRLLDPFFRNDMDGDEIVLGPPGSPALTNTDYGSSGNVVDADPRIISNLIVDQTSNNPAAVAVAGSAGADGIWGTDDDELNDGVSIIGRKAGADLALNTADDIVFFSFENVAPDEGLSAPFNLWFVFFGQFFDHGLDLVVKGGSGTVFVPLQPDDPLIAGADGAFGTADDLPPHLQFMVLTRATNQPGPDGVLGTEDDIHEHLNQTSPFVDQNQTYASTPSHQVFLREYQLNAEGRPVATGRLITNHEINPDGTLGADLGGMSTWAVVKAQARDLLGIQLTDHDVANVPLVKVDAYGNFIPGENGFAQIIVDLGADGIAQTDDDIVIEGDPTANGGLGVAIPLDAPRTGHPFLADIAHSANPFHSQTGVALAADADDVIGDDGDPNTYDDELLDEHFMAGDGRVNENIALTAVHHVFHAEHNRLLGHIQDVVLASAAEGDLSFLNEWLVVPVAEVPADLSSLVWNGERLFQAARFGTEMQYQHLVFEEFARKVQPQVDVFLQEGQGYDTTIDAAIVAEFAHVVYRFGHSMLLDEIERFDPSFASSQLGLIEAFLNPTAFDENGTFTADEAAGAIVRGTTRQVGNAIDEFKTEALRNNLLGLPLDLASINLARGRETGIPSLNAARATFYEWTGDSQLTPYASWIDFMQNLRHPESLVNFIAAYGTHSLITSQSTLEGMRAAAFAIVMGEPVTLSDGVTVLDAPEDRLDFLYGTGAWANDAGLAKDLDGVTTTGLGNVDFWIGGLAEQIMPFGGFLGSTFNYVFENQLEKLQNGDRFYYLERVAALNFLTELENNSFAKLIMANTDATHLPGDVFSTPSFILEVDQTRQFNEGTGVFLPGADGILGTEDDVEDTNADPVGDDPDPLNPLVIRDNPATPDPDANYLEYTGGDHVVLGGTDNDDIIIASIGDDTVYGDGGNDRLEGGDGNDTIRGGAGDDIITDTGGDDLLQGDDGNDAIHGGNGINLIIAGFGNDFVVTGEDSNETFGGPGNDFILGGPANELVLGNEGDDWIEGGMADGGPGDNFDARGLDLVPGNDIFIGTQFPDRMEGEGGDDIMMGNGGQVDRYLGGSGFDWAIFSGSGLAANVDLTIRAFDEAPVPLSEASALARFEETEGLSGSARSDILRGDDEDATTIPFNGAQGSTLTNFALIDGLQELVDGLLGAGQTSFFAGNIILGGSGSDIIEGRGGDDLIDGDHWLNVRISVRQNPDGTGDELFSVTSMTELVDLVFSGEINPGQLVAVREILPDEGTLDFDTAQFSDLRANYIIEVNGVEVAGNDITILDGDVVTVSHVLDDDGTPVAGPDGSDTLRHIERLQFADQTIVLRDGLNAEPVGQLVILDQDGEPVGTPVEGEVLTVSIDGVTDADNTSSGGAITGPVSYVWQVERRPGTGVFEDIIIETGLGDVRATGTTFTVTNDVDGLVIRAKAVYEDEHGVLETVLSAPTAPVQGVNNAPTGVPTISDTTPTEGLALTVLTATIIDPDGTDDAVAGGLFTFQWQQSASGGIWENATDVLGGGTSQIFLPDQSHVGLMLRVVATFIDDGGTVEIVTSAPTQPVADDGIFFGTEGDDVIIGTAAANQIFGLGGNDTLNGLEGEDVIQGNEGDDVIDGGDGVDFISGDDGNDTIDGGQGDDFISSGSGDDFVDGGPGADIMDSEDGNDTFVVDDPGDLVFDFGFDEGIDTILTTLGVYALDSFSGVENLTFIGTGSFTGTGNEFDNVITGGAGDDTLDGLDGNDTLDGGAGADVMAGGNGDDTYIVDDAGDQVIEGADSGTDTVRTLLGAYALGANVENLTFIGTGNFAGTGNELDNVITGGAGDDTLDGGDGSDTLNGGAGNDSLTGGAGNDSLVGNGGSDTLDGGGGSDTLDGGGGSDILNGNGGNDTLDGGAGADVMAGGNGDDTYIVDNAGDQVIEGADSGTDAVRTLLGAYALGANVENLAFIGTGNFNGTGNELDNVITGGAGDDTLGGNAGNDTLDGGDGSDTLSGGGGADTLNGGLGDDTLNGNGGNDTLDGGAGADAMTGGNGDDTYIVDNAGDQVIEGADSGTDAVHALLNAYTLTANVEDLTFIGTGNFTGTGNGLGNLITGGLGDDTLDGEAGNDTLDGGDGADTLFGGGGSDTLRGGAGDDTLRGNGGGDTLRGGGGSDTLVGGGGNDSIDAGAGDDTVIWSVGDGRDIVGGDAGTDTFVVNGSAANETFFIETVADYLARTGANPNTLQPGTEIVVSRATGAGAGTVVAELNGIDDIDIDGGGGNDTFVVSGDFSDTDLDPSTIRFHGSGGDDTLNLFGRVSDHRVLFEGRGGNDTVIGEVRDTDVLQVNEGEPEPTLLGDVMAIGTGGNDKIYGSDAYDHILGLGGNDRIYGTGGNDILDGGGGSDRMYGGRGDDTYIVDRRGDRVDEKNGEGIDTVETALGRYTLGSNVEDLTYTGTGGFAGTGNRLDNVIQGGSGDDRLNGLDGRDTLIGGAGDDVMIGGAGNDTFVFAPGFGNDVIVRFDANPARGQDLLDLSELGITADTFAASVTIADVGADTLVAIGADTITLLGVNGVGANTVTQQDFILA